MKKIAVGLGFWLVTLSGCSSLQSSVLMAPEATVTGSQVELQVLDSDGKLDSTVMTTLVQSTVEKWLTAHGYSLNRNPPKTHTLVSVKWVATPKTIHVPAHTHSYPFYWPYGDYGWWGFNSEYVGAHDREVYERGIEISMTRFERGKPPVVIMTGVAGPKNYSDPFYEKHEEVARAITSLLARSPLANGIKVSASTLPGDPACWFQTGISFSKEDEQTGTISNLANDGPALKVGLKKGDKIIEVDDSPYEPSLVQGSTEGQTIHFKVERAGTKLEFKVPVRLVCWN